MSLVSWQHLPPVPSMQSQVQDDHNCSVGITSTHYFHIVAVSTIDVCFGELLYHVFCKSHEFVKFLVLCSLHIVENFCHCNCGMVCFPHGGFHHVICLNLGIVCNATTHAICKKLVSLYVLAVFLCDESAEVREVWSAASCFSKSFSATSYLRDSLNAALASARCSIGSAGIQAWIS